VVENKLGSVSNFLDLFVDGLVAWRGTNQARALENPAIVYLQGTFGPLMACLKWWHLSLGSAAMTALSLLSVRLHRVLLFKALDQQQIPVICVCIRSRLGR
jgi:hypothetical protein